MLAAQLESRAAGLGASDAALDFRASDLMPLSTPPSTPPGGGGGVGAPSAEFAFVLVAQQSDHPAIDGGVVDVALARCTLRVAAQRPLLSSPAWPEELGAVSVRVLSEPTQGRYAADARLEMEGGYAAEDGAGGEPGAYGESVTLSWSVPSRLELDLRLITTGLAQPDLVLAAGALAPGGGSYAFWLEVRVRVGVRITVRVSLTRTRARTRALTLTLTLTRRATRRRTVHWVPPRAVSSGSPGSGSGSG